MKSNKGRRKGRMQKTTVVAINIKMKAKMIQINLFIAVVQTTEIKEQKNASNSNKKEQTNEYNRN